MVYLKLESQCQLLQTFMHSFAICSVIRVSQICCDEWCNERRQALNLAQTVMTRNLIMSRMNVHTRIFEERRYYVCNIGSLFLMPLFAMIKH